MRRAHGACRAIFCITAAAASSAAWSQSRTTFVDLEAGLGYSTNPLLVTGGSSGSAFGRVSANAVHAWSTERSSTSLSAYVENSTYFRRYSNRPIFSLGASTSYAASERLRLSGNLSFSGDLGGQLGTRFFAAPTGPTDPAPVVPVLPGVVIGGDPDLIGLSGRQYRLAGNVGASLALSQRDSINIVAGAQRTFFTGSSDDLEYSSYTLSGGYERQLSERVAVGARLSLDRTDFSERGDTTLISPQATIRAQLSEFWDASAAVGLAFTRQNDNGGSGTDVGLALDGQLCRRLENQRLCVRAARNSQSTAFSGPVQSTSVGLDYYRRIDARQTLQLSANASRFGGLRDEDSRTASRYFSASASYNRMLDDRFSTGVTLTARKLYQFGPDPKTDLGGSIYLRYRLGDLR